MLERESEVIDFETGPRTASLVPPQYGTDCGAAIALEWVSTATSDGPAILRATLTNQNEFRTKFRTMSLPLFNRVSWSMLRGMEYGYEEAIYLAPTADHPLVDEATGYERRANGHWHVTEVPPKQPDSLWLDPDGSVTAEYYLLGHHEADDITPGQYHFESGSDGFRIVVWDSDVPGPTDESKFGSATLLSLPRDDATAWYHEADATTAVSLRPSAEEVVIPGRLDFELVNHSHQGVEGNPLEWHLYKFHEGDWHRIAPAETLQPLAHLYPGDTLSYTLRVFHGDPVPCDEGYDVGHLGGGRYAFEIGKWESAVPAVAFDLLGDPIEVTPSDTITEVEQDGDSLRATSERGEQSGEMSRLATYTLTRVDSVPPDTEPRRLIAEQVVRRDQLRDALGLLARHEARSVTIAEYNSVRPPFGSRESGFVEYRGDVYEITTDSEE